MLGCLSVHSETPERVTGALDDSQDGEISSEEQEVSQGNELVEEVEGSGVASRRQILPNNASRRGTSRPARGTTRRSGSFRSFCRKVGKLFSNGFSRRSSNVSPAAHVSLDNRNRLRSEFRQRIMAALLSNDPAFGRPGPRRDREGLEGDSASPSSSSILGRRSLVAGIRRGMARQSDEVWQEIQDFASSQQGDVYVYIPYTHLDEAMGYLSQILPILSLSLRDQKSEGLTREEFERLPVMSEGNQEALCCVPHDCPVCYNPMLLGEDLVRLPCFEDHIFHKSCLWKWLSSHSTCPMCREKVEVPAAAAAEEVEEEQGGGCSMCDCCEGHENDENDDDSFSDQEEVEAPESGVDAGPSPSNISEVAHGLSPSRRIFIWSSARSSTPAILILSRGQRPGAH
ncbi:RING-type domain-containing protein [Chloropicon primus]|uniref:RING-type domain-containing protein n=1 Tax=Chloropicon primus TaxID=1764295 RepID=A0A5B8MK11_9CHLO|nr:hypothetical protein A3770_04p33110 [Chloropicon primus]UPR00006.1 RING-type domain-containing protein [Chloropicon primus]|eukprot:QDZ20793.1 hypothetical protein A3770_04p33110 [Chloropicon primus]